MKTEIIEPFEVYNRIASGKPFGKNLKIYPKSIVISVRDMLAEHDEFEKCIELNRFMEERFRH